MKKDIISHLLVRILYLNEYGYGYEQHAKREKNQHVKFSTFYKDRNKDKNGRRQTKRNEETGKRYVLAEPAVPREEGNCDRHPKNQCL